MASVMFYLCSAVVAAVLLTRTATTAGDCPAACTCLGILLDCSEKGLVSVPSDLQRRDWGMRLELQSNAIQTIQPDDFKGLHKLEVLYLSNNDIASINGSVFDDLFSLHTLEIAHNKLTEMPVFPSHLNITELSLAHNQIHTISPEALQALPHLKVLDLNNNQIMDIPIHAFSSPSQLTHLFLSHNKIMRLEPGCLDNLTALEQLKLNRNQMFELRKDIFSTLANLRFLELSRNKISSIQALAFVGLKNLQVLKLKRNSIATLMDGAFWGLENINSLQLDNNHISNVTSKWLFGLTSLKHLSLSYNRIDHIQQDGWDCCGQSLNSLDLTHNQLEMIHTNTFSKLTRLQSLWLDHNRLSRIDEGAFDGLRDLITLELNDNDIAWTVEDMSGAFMGLQKLMKLGLKMNHIKSITKQAFTGLASLQQLHLEDNAITTVQENSFEPLANLRELHLNSTKLLCDCHLGWLAGWLRRFGFHSSVRAVCSHPESLEGRSIFDVSVEEFQCNDKEILKPMILSSPKAQNSYKGENLTLTCMAAITEDAPPTIQWKKDSLVLSDSMVETVASTEGDIKHYTSQLHLHNVQNNMAGNYQCVVSNGFGASFSTKAKIDVYVFPVFIKQPEDITVKAGQSAKLQCSARGHPQPEISWKKDGGEDFPAARERRVYVIPKDDHFFIAATKNVDEGVYTCQAKSPAGVITSSARVTVLETPDFMQPMVEEKITGIGETTVLECMASGSPRPSLLWFKDAKPVAESPRHFFTASNQLLIIVGTTEQDGGVYTCQISNTLGIMRGTTKLTVLSSAAAQREGRDVQDCSHYKWKASFLHVLNTVFSLIGASIFWTFLYGCALLKKGSRRTVRQTEQQQTRNSSVSSGTDGASYRSLSAAIGVEEEQCESTSHASSGDSGFAGLLSSQPSSDRTHSVYGISVARTLRYSWEESPDVGTPLLCGEDVNLESCSAAPDTGHQSEFYSLAHGDNRSLSGSDEVMVSPFHSWGTGDGAEVRFQTFHPGPASHNSSTSPPSAGSDT